MASINSSTKRLYARVRFIASAIISMLTFSLTGCYDSYNNAPYRVNTPIESRSISFENITGEKGKGGMAEREVLGVGRKGAPLKYIEPGETVVLCDIAGPAVIHHIWMTSDQDEQMPHDFVIRTWWDGQEHPSIEAPIGAFFGYMHGKLGAYQSAVHSVNPLYGMNIWLDMPFTRNAKFTITNEGKVKRVLFYNIDYTIGTKLPKDVGRLHILFRRENPTVLAQDFEILPKRTGMGRFMGCVLGVRSLNPGTWFGEGEFKVYLDGDKEFPTICGTGTEDYIGQSWGLQDVAYLYGGTSYQKDRHYTFYRWHIKDPLYWKKDVRITMQQIAWSKENNIHEVSDDWSCSSFWYEPIPSAPLPEMPDIAARKRDYPEKPQED